MFLLRTLSSFRIISSEDAAWCSIDGKFIDFLLIKTLEKKIQNIDFAYNSFFDCDGRFGLFRNSFFNCKTSF